MQKTRSFFSCSPPAILCAFVLLAGCKAQNFAGYHSRQNIDPTTFSAQPYGFNYSPLHIDKLTRNSIFADLQLIAENLGPSSEIRTTRSVYPSMENSDLRIADLVHEFNIENKTNLKILVGVHEFQEQRDLCKDGDKTIANSCLALTQKQIEAAIEAANSYSETIGVVVGNNDAGYSLGKENGYDTIMTNRIANDIVFLRSKLDRRIPVFTSQTQDFWQKNAASTLKLAKVSDTIGLSIYPYFAGENDPIVATLTVESKVNSLKAKFHKPVIVTEEGWPSAGNGNPNGSLANQKNYFTAWQETDRAQKSVSLNNDFVAKPLSSFYFSVFEATDSSMTGPVMRSFGLFKADRSSKDIITTHDNP